MSNTTFNNILKNIVRPSVLEFNDKRVVSGSVPVAVLRGWLDNSAINTGLILTSKVRDKDTGVSFKLQKIVRDVERTEIEGALALIERMRPERLEKAFDIRLEVDGKDRIVGVSVDLDM